jgi:hypothetical protein
MVAKTEKTVVKIKCMKCGTERTSSPATYYENHNPLLSSEKLEICKICILGFIGENDGKCRLDKIYLVLAMLDKPFILETWEKCNGEWSKYIPQISTLPHFKGMTFKDSNFGITNKKIQLSRAEQDFDTEYNDDELNALSKFWGKGIDIEDLEFLQSEYQKFINSYECDSYAMELLFQEASQQRLSIKKLRLENKSVDKELKTLQDILGSANIKPAQESGANAVEQSTFGTLIKKYENERPIPEPDEAWKDVDGIGKYISVWFFGHFSKMLGIKNEHTDLYEKEIKKYTVDTPLYEDEEIEPLEPETKSEPESELL